MPHLRGCGRVGRIRPAIDFTAIGFVALTVGSCQQAQRLSSASTSATLRVGTAQLAAINPAQGIRQLTQLLTVESLVRVGEDGRLEPILAEKWSVTHDGRSILLTLRPGVKFHDGTPLDAKAIVEVLPGGLRSFWGSLADDVAQISAVAENTVEIVFRRPSPLLQEMLEVTIRKPGESTVGTGPFMVAQDSATALQANPAYYLGSPRIGQVNVTNFQAIRTAWAELLRNRIDMLWEVGPDALESLESSTTVATFTFTRHYQYALALNTRAPALRSATVRRALNMAIDRTALVREALNGHGVPSSGPIWPGYWALPTPVPRFEFDPAVAERTLNEGHQKRITVRFTCTIPPDAVYERIALELKRQLQAVGVEMDVQAMPVDQIFEAEKRRSFEAVLVDVISAPTVLRVYNLWDSHADGNPGGFGNDTVDAAFDRVIHAESDAAYRQAISGLQHAFIDDAPAIFLAWQQRARAISKRFAVPPPEAGRDVLNTIRLWSPRNNDARLASRN